MTGNPRETKLYLTKYLILGKKFYKWSALIAF